MSKHTAIARQPLFTRNLYHKLRNAIIKVWNRLTLKSDHIDDSIPPLTFVGGIATIATMYLAMCFGAAYGL